MPRKPDPTSRAGFIRAQPREMSASDVVAAAKSKNITIDEKYVYSVRTSMKAKTRAKKRVASRSTISGARARVGAPPSRSSGLEAEIERIVERTVTAVLKSKFGALFG